MGKSLARVQKKINAGVDASKLAVGGTVAFTDGEKGALRDLHGRRNNLKIALADVVQEIARLDAVKAETLAALAAANKAVTEQAHSALRAHGIDPDDQSKGWSLDLASLTVTRVK